MKTAKITKNKDKKALDLFRVQFLITSFANNIAKTK